MNAIVPSSLARKAVEVGFKNHWRFRAVQPVTYDRDWRTEEVTEVPQTAQDRLQALKNAGVGIRTILIAHEAPRLLVAPKAAPKPAPQKTTKTNVDFGAIVEVFVFIVSILFQAVLLDPALIVELEDGTWLEVMTWYE